jgi:hypothetical protein
LDWTEKQREVAALLASGKSFMEVVNAGYSLSMVHRVSHALNEGQKPTPLDQLKDGESDPGGGSNEQGESDKNAKGGRPLVAVVGPRSAPITFRVDSKQISIDPLELHRQYGLYADLAKDNSFTLSFSQLQTIGIQIAWVMLQDIPITENFLRALFYAY